MQSGEGGGGQGGSGSGYGPPPPAGGYAAPPGGGYGPPPAPGGYVVPPGGGFASPTGGGYAPSGPSGTVPGPGYTPSGYGPPPQAGGYAPPGSPIAGAPGGPPPPPGGAGAPAPGAAAPAKPAKPSRTGRAKGIALLVGAVIAALAVGFGVYAAVWYYGSVSPQLAKYMPKDTQFYVEVPNLTKAIVKFAGSDIIETSEIDTDKQLQNFSTVLADSFDNLKKDDAQAFLRAINGIAIGMRGGDRDRRRDAVVMISFSSADPVAALLKTSRFEKADKIAGGQAYTLNAGEGKDIENPIHAAISRMRIRGDSEAFVWFEETKTIVFGSSDMVSDCGKVMRGDKDALSTTDHFKAGKYESGAIALAWMDGDMIAEQLDRDGKSDVKRMVFDNVGPITFTTRVASGGLVMTVNGDARGKAVPDEKLIPKGGSMNLWEKLPDTTIAYFASSNTNHLDAKEYKELVFDWAKQIDKNARKADKGFDKLEDTLGISFDKIYEALGDQMIAGLVTTDKFKVDKDLRPDDLKESLGVEIIVKIRDNEAAQKVLKTVREQVFEDGPLARKFDVDKKDDGFIATMKSEDNLYVRFILRDDYLLVLGGQKKLIDKMIDAFEGDHTLKDVKAHKLALGSLDTKPTWLLWGDTGRAMKDLLADADDIKDKLKEYGVPYKALKLDGDERMTSVIAIELKPEEGGLRYRVETLNVLPALPAFVGVPLLIRGKRSVTVDSPDFDPPPIATAVPADSTGNATCDRYLEKVRTCGGPMGAAIQRNYASLAETLKRSVRTDPTMMEQSCSRMIDALKDQCN